VLELKSNADDVSDNVGDFSKKFKDDAQSRLNRAGTFLEKEMVHKIESGLKPALSKETIARKGSSVPLFDTGELISQIDHKLSKGCVEVGVFGSRASIAKIHEFGANATAVQGFQRGIVKYTKKYMIPERSFMRSALEGNKNTIKDILKGK
jgi:phage gpG-like protein